MGGFASLMVAIGFELGAISFHRNGGRMQRSCSSEAESHRCVVISRPMPLRLLGGAVMKSKEDIEFEEWARKKKIAAGIDPDEDFGASRRAENSIYLVGGLITILVPVIAGTWAYNAGYLTPQ